MIREEIYHFDLYEKPTETDLVDIIDDEDMDCLDIPPIGPEEEVLFTFKVDLDDLEYEDADVLISDDFEIDYDDEV